MPYSRQKAAPERGQPQREVIKMLFQEYFQNGLPSVVRIHLDFNLTDQAYTFHLHREVTELVYVASGSGIYMINRQPFSVEAGDFLVIESGILHAGASSPHNPMKTLAAVISNVHWRNPTLPNYIIDPRACPVMKASPRTQYFGSALMELWRIYQQPEPDTEIGQVILAPLLIMLRKYAAAEQPFYAVQDNPAASKILEYLYQHYNENITLESLSSHFYISSGHINHLFQKEYQISPINYLIDVRFSKAKAFLINTDLSISEIAGHVGYSNPAHFTKLFMKRIGYSPNDYRMLHKNSSQSPEQTRFCQTERPPSDGFPC